MRNLVPLLLVMLAAAAPPPVPAYTAFGRWIVACDNIRHCEARGFDETRHADLRVVRDAGAATARITLTVEAPPAPETIQLDDTPIALASPAWAADAHDGTRSTTDPATVAAFLDAARNAHKLIVKDGSVPLDGMVAALLRVDAIQGRENTPAPLMAPKGIDGAPGAPGLPGRPAWRPPAPLMRPADLIVRTRRDQAKALADEQCDRASDDKAYALDAGHDLVILGCQLYAYQASFMVFITTRDGPATPFRPRLPLEDHPTTLLLEAGFDPATGTLSSTSKGRGLADCGSAADWIWSAGAFRLLQLSWLEACGSAQAGDWPIVYRTQPPGR